MKGAIVFLVVFAIVLVVTLAYISIPPGKAIYRAALPKTDTTTPINTWRQAKPTNFFSYKSA
jgi:hypothetical protein